MVHPGTRAGGVVDADTFRPPRALGVIVGGAFTVWAAFIALVAGVLAGGAAIEPTTFLAWVVVALFAGVALLFGWWTLGVARLAYNIDDDALRIRWAGGEVIVPVVDIQRVVPGRTVGEESVTGLNWWGCHIGRGVASSLGPTLFFATHNRPEDNVFVVTPGRTYGLTVPDQVAFAEACSRRLIVGFEPGEPQRSERQGFSLLPLWRDGDVWFVFSLVLVGLGVLGGYLFTQYPDLPALVQIDFPKSTGIVRVGERSELLRIGAVGGVIVAVNLVLGFILHARERAAGLWLLASAALIQAVLLGAAIVAFERA
ncbi:MAG: PH domain-containing protein [Chloroflexi bacterium]|nr:PH domain-containing protein [Chloroflexota bacterium]